MTNSVGEIPNCDVLFVIGANPTEAHPVIGLKIKQAVRNGARLIVADPRAIWFTKIAWLHLPIRPGTDLALINGMAHVILSEGLANDEFIDSRTEGFEEFRKAVDEWPPERAAEVCGVPVDDIRRAAREYAQSDRGAIFYTLGITEHVCGTHNVLGLANLALLTGQIGKESSGVNPLRGQNNVQGACDMGAQVDVFPGYQKVAVEENRRKFEEAWNVNLPQSPGLTIPDMFEAAFRGDVKGMFILGEDPVMSEAHAGFVREALMRLDFIAAQDIFLSETAKLADVVLPASCFAEKDGTFTNTERRVQRVRKAVDPPGDAREDWRVLTELMNRLGYPVDYSSPEEIWDEIRSLAPSFAGISYPRIENVGLQWPCPTLDHSGTEFLHAERFARGLGKFHAVEYTPPSELTDRDHPWILSTGRTLYHYNAGTMTRRVDGIDRKSPECFVEIHPKDLEKLRVQDGSMLRVTTRRGSVVARAAATKKVKPGNIWMPFHFAEAAANELTIDAYDEITRTAEYKVSAANVEPAEPMKLISVGGVSSGCGKTSVVSLLLQAFPGWAVIKVTPCRPGEACPHGDDCGACRPPEGQYEVVTDVKALARTGKDTARFIEAGASQVAWVRALPEFLGLGLQSALDRLRNAPGVIIESTTAMPFIDGLRIMVVGRGRTGIKESAAKYSGLAQVFAINADAADGDQTPSDRERYEEIATRLAAAGAMVVDVYPSLPPDHELNRPFILDVTSVSQVEPRRWSKELHS